MNVFFTFQLVCIVCFFLIKLYMDVTYSHALKDAVNRESQNNEEGSKGGEHGGVLLILLRLHQGGRGGGGGGGRR